MPTTLNKLVTIEEFEKYPELPDGSKEELVRGEVITMPPPQSRHGMVQLQIGHLLKSVVGPKKLGWVMTETGVIVERDPDSLFGPDVVFWSVKRVPERPEGYIEIPADLVVEVLSPDDRKKYVREKIKDYITCGVKLVWLVDPEIRTVTVYAGSMRGTELDENETITGGDVLPEFSCKVADFFE
jgi:Uma2 family endonuclease